MENFKKITGAEFVRIVTGGEFCTAGYLSKPNARWDMAKQHYVSDPLNTEEISSKISVKIDAILKFFSLGKNDWKTARARSRDIVHSDDVYEDLKDSTFYLMEHAGSRVLVHDYLDGANISVKLMKN